MYMNTCNIILYNDDIKHVSTICNKEETRDSALVEHEHACSFLALPLRRLGYSSGGNGFVIVRHAKSNIYC